MAISAKRFPGGPRNKLSIGCDAMLDVPFAFINFAVLELVAPHDAPRIGVAKRRRHCSIFALYSFCGAEAPRSGGVSVNITPRK